MTNEFKHTAWSCAMAFLAMATMLMLPDMAHAAAPAGNAIGGVLCQVVNLFTGQIGQGLATIAIIVIGVGALMGKVSWGMAIIVGIGVGIIFGASNLVDLLANSSSGATVSGC